MMFPLKSAAWIEFYKFVCPSFQKSPYLILSFVLLTVVSSPGLALQSSSLDRTGTQWSPYIEWQVDNASYSGNPFDVQATVQFVHDGSGETRQTPMFYIGANRWAFRFSGTQTGLWHFDSQSSDPELANLSGSVTINPNPDPNVNGFVTNLGNKWGFSGSGRAFVPQFVMAGGPQYYYADMSRLTGDIQTLMVGHGFTGFHVPVFCRWFDINEPVCNNINPANANPDLRTFEALEDMITQVYAQGGVIHFWMWGDSQRGMNPSAWGLNGTVDQRLQRYIAARLGPLPGWTMGYGFDLFEWVNGATLTQWHDNMHNWMGWDHYLGARSNTNSLGQISEAMDYSSYEQHRPDYDTYVTTIETRPNKPSFSEDRFRVRDEGRSKDYSFEDVRRGLWRSTMAGGIANIWGNLLGAAGPNINLGSSSSQPFPNQAEISTYFTFFENRFLADMQRCNQLTSGTCLQSSAADSLVFYAENVSSMQIDLSALAGNFNAVLVDAGKPYAELPLNLTASNQVVNLDYSSDWAIAVSTGADSPAPSVTPLPTETAVPPTETPLPTATLVPATETPLPTETLLPPTETPQPTNTATPMPQPTAPTVMIVISPRGTNLGDTIDVRVELVNGVDVYGLQTECFVDPAVLTGSSFTEGDLFNSSQSMFIGNTAAEFDSSTGRWLVAATRLNPSPAINGSGIAYTLSYSIQNPGNTSINCSAVGVNVSGFNVPLDLISYTEAVGPAENIQETPTATETLLPTATALPSETLVPTALPTETLEPSATLTETPMPTATLEEATPLPTEPVVAAGSITGVVLFQNHPDNASINVELLDETQTTMDQTLTSSSGDYSFNAVAAGTYTIRYSAPQHIIVLYQAVLDSDGQVLDLGQIRLQAGDVNDDGTIDLTDASFVGANYGLQAIPEIANGDLNADGIINVSDLALLGGNFGAESPVTLQP